MEPRRAATPSSRSTLEPTSSEFERAEPFEPAHSWAARIQKQTTAKLFLLSGISLALASALTDASSLALFFGSEELPRLQGVGIFMAISALLVGALSVWLLGMAIARLTQWERHSNLIMLAGWLAGFLIGIFSVLAQWDVFGVFVTVSLLAGGSIGLALAASNPQLSRQILGIIVAGWLIGFLAQGAALAYVYASVLETVWEWLSPLQESVGDKPLLVVQIGIVGFFLGMIAPLIGIPVMYSQLQNSSAQSQSSAKRNEQ